MDDRFDDLLRDAARDYNEPPETPREEIWARIVSERSEKSARPLRHFRPLALAAGIAAILALGIGVGRLSISPTVPAPSQPVATQPEPATSRVNPAAYELATTEYLSQSEAFLTLFRASLRQNAGGNEQLAAATARQLLATNRLLLDSPAAKDHKTKLLLQDLELVLAQIAQLSPQSRSRDLELITEGLERAAVMNRLRMAVPSGPSNTQGAL
jgi:hypothetical protein